MIFPLDSSICGIGQKELELAGTVGYEDVVANWLFLLLSVAHQILFDFAIHPT
jgi:hypothetical protein